jgi:hypothetical protein
MTIYILGSQEETAQALDDKSLSRQIKAVSETLCNVHFENLFEEDDKPMSEWSKAKKEKWLSIPGMWDTSEDKYLPWARECIANYEWLVRMGLACCEEYSYRFGVVCDHCYGHSPGLRGGCGKCLGRGVLMWTKLHKLQSVITWCELHRPDLPAGEITPFPVCVPEEHKALAPYFDMNYQLAVRVSYRNYYRAKLENLNQCDGCKSGNHKQPLPSGSIACQKDKYTPVWTKRQRPEWLRPGKF